MTPTSTTPARSPGEAGFSLIELMVMLLIVGLVTGTAMLALPDPAPRLGAVAETFASRLVHAQQEAILVNRTVDVAVGSEGYRFRSQSPTGLVELNQPPFEPAVWGAAVTARLETADGSDSVRFDATGAASPASIRLAHDGREVEVGVDEAGNVRIDAVRP